MDFNIDQIRYLLSLGGGKIRLPSPETSDLAWEMHVTTAVPVQHIPTVLDELRQKPF